ncbi:MAG: hypothetical protein QM479_15425 [Pseudomonadota bacterium]
MMQIKDFNETELWTIQEILNERWKKRKVELQQADVEIKLFPGDRELTECPAVFWEYRKSSFVIFKVADTSYKGQFYYLGREQYGTNVTDFDNIHDCVVTILQVHADLETEKRTKE